MASETMQTEQQFASLVDELAHDSSRREELIALLREGHPLYDGRGASTIVRMRGWALLSLARAGLTDDSLIYLLEELDTGVDAYLVASAARALRSCPSPQGSFAPFVMRAITQIRYRDESVSLEGYGEYAVGSSGTSAVRELLETLAWLGPNARGVLSEIESLKVEPGGLGKKLHAGVDRALEAIRTGEKSPEVDCCALPSGVKSVFSWTANARRGCETIESTVFQDHAGAAISFREFFYRGPTIVVFFYTRCDNPLKCSLTITKLARIQKLLSDRGLGDRIQTAAITYDPAFDLPERMQRYGERRGVSFGDGHRMLRAVDGIEVIRKHFRLGVNFIESLVNRHRIEVYVLDERGRVAASFERLHWDEQEVVQRAIDVLGEGNDHRTPPSISPTHAKVAPVFGTIASLALAMFPKCPLCWAGYMSFFGIAGLEGVPYSPWLQPLLAVVIAINVGSVWLRARATGRMMSFFLVSAGALMIVLSRASGFQRAALLGVLLTMTGSFLSTFTTRNQNKAKA